MNNQPQPNQPGQQQIKIADNIPGAEYSNAAQINHNKEEFHLIFLNIFPPSGKVVSKVITSPGHFKKMIVAMNENLKKYEDKFGKIEEISAIDKEIGFGERA